MSEYKIKGYAARDKGENGMGEVYFGTEKPTWDNDMGFWWDFGDHAMHLPNDWFPELKWSNEPIEVELTIKKA